MMINKDKNRLLRPTAWLTLLLFLIQQLFTQASASYAQMASEVFSAQPFQELPRIDIPEQFGKIDEIVQSAQPGPVVVHIQNAHGNYEAQKNIQSILDYLTKTQDVKVLFLEGAKGKLHPELFRLFPEDPKLNIKIAEDFTKKAELTGAELFLIQSMFQQEKQSRVEAYGMEDAAAYRKNRKAFQAVLRASAQTEIFLKDMDAQIENLTAPYLNTRLKYFLRQLEAYETKQMNFSSWLHFAGEQAKKYLEIDLNNPFYQQDWPMLVRFFRLEQIQPKLKRPLLEEQGKAFIAKLTALDMDPVLIEKIQTLIQLPQGDISTVLSLPYGEALQILEDLLQALPADFSFADYENLKLYLQYLLLGNEVKSRLLFDEIEKMESRIGEALALTPVEKKLLALFRDYRLLKKLFALDLTRKDYDEMMEREQSPAAAFSLQPSEITERFKTINEDQRVRNIQFTHLDQINRLFDLARAFYQGANQRDHLMADRVFETMRNLKQSKVIIVTGGFHSEGMKQYFENKGFSYFLVSPQITKDISGNAYRSVMLEENFSIAASQIENVLPGVQPRNGLKQLTGEDYGHLFGSRLSKILSKSKISPQKLARVNSRLLRGHYGIRVQTALQKLSRSELRNLSAKEVEAAVQAIRSLLSSADDFIDIPKRGQDVWKSSLGPPGSISDLKVKAPGLDPLDSILSTLKFFKGDIRHFTLSVHKDIDLSGLRIALKDIYTTLSDLLEKYWEKMDSNAIPKLGFVAEEDIEGAPSLKLMAVRIGSHSPHILIVPKNYDYSTTAMWLNKYGLVGPSPVPFEKGRVRWASAFPDPETMRQLLKEAQTSFVNKDHWLAMGDWLEENSKNQISDPEYQEWAQAVLDLLEIDWWAEGEPKNRNLHEMVTVGLNLTDSLISIPRTKDEGQLLIPNDLIQYMRNMSRVNSTQIQGGTFRQKLINFRDQYPDLASEIEPILADFHNSFIPRIHAFIATFRILRQIKERSPHFFEQEPAQLFLEELARSAMGFVFQNRSEPENRAAVLESFVDWWPKDRRKVFPVLALPELLEDPSPDVRERAAQALGNIGPSAFWTVPFLNEAVRVSNSAIDALGNIGGPLAVSILKRLSTQGDKRTRNVKRMRSRASTVLSKMSQDSIEKPSRSGRNPNDSGTPLGHDGSRSELRAEHDSSDQRILEIQNQLRQIVRGWDAERVPEGADNVIPHLGKFSERVITELHGADHNETPEYVSGTVEMLRRMELSGEFPFMYFPAGYADGLEDTQGFLGTFPLSVAQDYVNLASAYYLLGDDRVVEADRPAARLVREYIEKMFEGREWIGIPNEDKEIIYRLSSRIQGQNRTAGMLGRVENQDPAYGHVGWIRAVNVLPSRQIVTAGQDRTVRIWDVKNPQNPRMVAVLGEVDNQDPAYGHVHAITAVSVLPNGQIVTAGGDHTTRIWDVKDPQNPRMVAVLGEVDNQDPAYGHVTFISDVSVLPNGQIVTASEDGTARIWDMKDPKNPRMIAVLGRVGNDHTAYGHVDGITAVSVLPNGQIVTAGGDSTARIWDVKDPQNPRTVAVLGRVNSAYEHVSYLSAVRVLPNGEIVTAGGDRTAQIWDVKDSQNPRMIAVLGRVGNDHTAYGHVNRINAVSVLPNGQIVTAGDDSTVRIWDVKDPQNPRMVAVLGEVDNQDPAYGHIEGIFAVSALPNGQIVTASYDHTARIWNLLPPVSAPASPAVGRSELRPETNVSGTPLESQNPIVLGREDSSKLDVLNSAGRSELRALVNRGDAAKSAENLEAHTGSYFNALFSDLIAQDQTIPQREPTEALLKALKKLIRQWWASPHEQSVIENGEGEGRSRKKGIKDILRELKERSFTYLFKREQSDVQLVQNIKTPANYGMNQPAERAKKRREALLGVVTGKIVSENFFGGETKLNEKLGMYFVDPVAMEKSRNPERDLPQGIDPNITAPLGPRQILAYRMAIERELQNLNMTPQQAKELDIDLQNPLAKVRLIIHVSRKNKQAIVEDFAAHQFYGFSNENVFFVEQDAVQGWSFEAGLLGASLNWLKGAWIQKAKESPFFTADHGNATLQLGRPQTAFRVFPSDKNSEEHETRLIEESLVKFLENEKAEMIVTRRDNDLTQITPEVLDLDRLGTIIAIFEDSKRKATGVKMITEMTQSNDPDRGKSVELKQVMVGPQMPHQFLIEGMWHSVTSNYGDVPTNAFRNAYLISGLEKTLQAGLPVWLQFKGGYLYPRMISGDLTLSLRNERYMMSSKEMLNNINSERDFYAAFKLIAKQDQDKYFSALATEYEFRSEDDAFSQMKRLITDASSFHIEKRKNAAEQLPGLALQVAGMDPAIKDQIIHDLILALNKNENDRKNNRNSKHLFRYNHVLNGIQTALVALGVEAFFPLHDALSAANKESNPEMIQLILEIWAQMEPAMFRKILSDHPNFKQKILNLLLDQILLQRKKMQLAALIRIVMAKIFSFDPELLKQQLDLKSKDPEKEGLRRQVLADILLEIGVDKVWPTSGDKQAFLEDRIKTGMAYDLKIRNKVDDQLTKVILQSLQQDQTSLKALEYNIISKIFESNVSLTREQAVAALEQLGMLGVLFSEANESHRQRVVNFLVERIRGRDVSGIRLEKNIMIKSPVIRKTAARAFLWIRSSQLAMGKDEKELARPIADNDLTKEIEYNLSLFVSRWNGVQETSPDLEDAQLALKDLETALMIAEKSEDSRESRSYRAPYLALLDLDPEARKEILLRFRHVITYLIDEASPRSFRSETLRILDEYGDFIMPYAVRIWMDLKEPQEIREYAGAILDHLQVPQSVTPIAEAPSLAQLGDSLALEGEGGVRTMSVVLKGSYQGETFYPKFVFGTLGESEFSRTAELYKYRDFRVYAPQSFTIRKVSAADVVVWNQLKEKHPANGLPEIQEGQSYLVFSGVPGRHLEDFLDESMPQGQVPTDAQIQKNIKILNTVARLILRFHQQRRTHGDLYRSVLVSEDGNHLGLIDFSLSTIEPKFDYLPEILEEGGGGIKALGVLDPFTPDPGPLFWASQIASKTEVPQTQRREQLDGLALLAFGAHLYTKLPENSELRDAFQAKVSLEQGKTLEYYSLLSDEQRKDRDVLSSKVIANFYGSEEARRSRSEVRREEGQETRGKGQEVQRSLKLEESVQRLAISGQQKVDNVLTAYPLPLTADISRLERVARKILDNIIPFSVFGTASFGEIYRNLFGFETSAAASEFNPEKMERAKGILGMPTKINEHPAYILGEEIALKGAVAFARPLFGKAPVVVITQRSEVRKKVTAYNEFLKQKGQTPLEIADSVEDAIQKAGLLSSQTGGSLRGLTYKALIHPDEIDEKLVQQLEQWHVDITRVTQRMFDQLTVLPGINRLMEEFRSQFQIAKSA